MVNKKESAWSDMQRTVKRLRRKHRYPPDTRAEAVVTVIKRAERVCEDWATAA